MRLPLIPPVEPMLSKLADELPRDDGWIFEPKWDGFRAIVFRDGDELLIQSRDKKPLNRYFPELDQPLRQRLPARSVIDGEIVIAGPKGLDFEALLLRIHPAESRAKMLGETTPASFVAWDLLVLGEEDLTRMPFEARRERLVQVLGDVTHPVYVTPATRDRALAEDWFARFEGAGLDGVMAKRAEQRYEPGKRAMLKIKHARTADCVVGGFRWYKDSNGTQVGSLLLGLYDEENRLHHVGIASSFSAVRRKELLGELEPSRGDALKDHPWREWRFEEGQRVPGGGSRWNRGKDLSWQPLRIERVCEVSYDHLQGKRFRHGTHFLRWRPDKPPSACRYDQLEVTAPCELAQIFKKT